MLIVSSRLAAARHIAALRFNGIKIETSKKIWIYYKDLSEHRANINICCSIIIFVKRKGNTEIMICLEVTVLQCFAQYYARKHFLIILVRDSYIRTTVLLMRCIMLHYFLEFAFFCFWINKESRYWSLIHTTATWYRQVKQERNCRQFCYFNKYNAWCALFLFDFTDCNWYKFNCFAHTSLLIKLSSSYPFLVTLYPNIVI